MPWALLLLIAVAAAPALAQGPDSVLIYTGFKIDKKFKTIGRITNTGSATEVDVLFICPGDSQGFCPFLRTTFELDRNETRVFNVADLDPPCSEGYFLAVSLSNEDLIGSYEIAKGKVGKLRESDNAIGLDGSFFGQHLSSDVRASAGKDGSAVILIDLRAAEAIFDVEDGPIVAQPVEITGKALDGGFSFTFAHEFTCYERAKLDSLNTNFGRQTLGDYGSIWVVGLEREDAEPSVLIGAICETGKGSQSKRAMFDLVPADQNGGVE